MRTCKVLVPAGVLGAGVDDLEMDYALWLRPDAIGIDGGSTDSGPYYLGEGVSKMTEKAIASDLKKLLRLRQALNIPLLIGSSGTCGTDGMVDWMAAICQRVAKEENSKIRVALIYSEQDRDVLKCYASNGRITPLAPAGAIDAATLDRCDHIVALAGYEPYAEALRQGADVVIGGRTTDTAVLAAVPLMRGLPAGPSWHAAKSSECGSLVAANTSRSSAVMMLIDEKGFEIQPMEKGVYCTPQSVAAHLLYENSNPYELTEPGTILDTRAAHYHQVSETTVRVEGSVCREIPYTLKLEGSGKVGYRTMVFSGISQPDVLMNFDTWLNNLSEFLTNGIEKVLGYTEDDYSIDFRPYGWNALDPHNKPTSDYQPREVGLMTLVTATSQAIATEIIKYCNPYILHFPLKKGGSLPSFAFPYSPADVELGPVYEFQLQHVVHVNDPMELIRIDWMEI